jgi:hypothetical protein
MGQFKTNMQNIQAKVISLAQDLTNGVVRRVDFLNYPEHFLTRAAIKPEEVEKLYRFKLEIRYIPGSKKIESLNRVLSSLSLGKPEIHYDVRWGCLLFDAEGNKCHTIFYDRRKKGGFIDGEMAGFDQDFSGWIETNIRPSFD